MVGDFLPILMLLGLSTLFGVGSIWVGQRLGPQRPNPAKEAPYECGIVPEHEPRERLPIKFYLIAMLFIIFDVEVIFFYPWAVIFRELRLFGLAEMAIFVAFLLAAYFYVWRGGGLEWEEEERVSLREALSRQLIARARERERMTA